jgi:hypothetical protein
MLERLFRLRRPLVATGVIVALLLAGVGVFNDVVAGCIRVYIGTAFFVTDPTALAAETFPLSERVTKPAQTASINALVGSWEADIHTRDNETYRELLTLDEEPYVIVSGKRFGHANEKFRQSNGMFLSACDGYWWLTSTELSSQADQLEIHIDGNNTTSGRRCFREILIRFLSKNTIAGEYRGAWLWPYPLGGQITYRRANAAQTYP